MRELSFSQPLINRETAIHRLDQMFGSAAAAQHTLQRMIWPHGFQCRKCSHRQYRHLKIRDVYQCRRCKSQHHLTAGTPMAGSRTSMVSWALILFNVTHPYLAIENDLIVSKHANISPRQIDRRMELLKNDSDESNAFLAAFTKAFYAPGLQALKESARGY